MAVVTLGFLMVQAMATRQGRCPVHLPIHPVFYFFQFGFLQPAFFEPVKSFNGQAGIFGIPLLYLPVKNPAASGLQMVVRGQHF